MEERREKGREADTVRDRQVDEWREGVERKEGCSRWIGPGK